MSFLRHYTLQLIVFRHYFLLFIRLKCYSSSNAYEITFTNMDFEFLHVILHYIEAKKVALVV
jgi:hypothetical protein